MNTVRRLLTGRLLKYPPSNVSSCLDLSSTRSLTVSARQRIAGGRLGVYTDMSRSNDVTPAQEKPVDYTRLPKVELHVHMDGACRHQTLRELSQQYEMNYPHDNEEEFKKQVMLLAPAESLTHFLQTFKNVSDILCTKESMERVAYEYCETLKKQNVVYFELRYAPMSHKMRPEDYIEGIMAGLERGERDFGIKSRQIFAFLRHQPDNVSKTLELALKYRSRGVVGVDMAGDELLPLDPQHVQGFLNAKAKGLHITVHAGESGPAANVRQAIKQLGAERIGHGYRVLEDEAVYQLAKERNIHFEVCPTSSIFTNSQKFESHALRRWALDGISFSLNTDDPGIIGNDLQTEYRVASQTLGLDKTQIVKSVLSSVEASFLPDDEKAELLVKVKEDIAEWESGTQWVELET